MRSGTASQDPVAALTAPGGPFEITVENVNGVPMQVYRDRRKSLRELVIGAESHGAADALVQGEVRLTYGETLARIRSTAASLTGLGVERGDRVAILAANGPDWLIAFWATVSPGAISVPLNAWWKTEELAFVLADSGSKVVICDARRYGVIEDVIGGLDEIETVVVMGDSTPGSTPAFEPLANGQLDAPWSETPIAEDDPAVILYTSGTTGKPKGSIQTHRSVLANLQNVLLRAAIGRVSAAAERKPRTRRPKPTDQKATLSILPLFHVSGVLGTAVPAFFGGVKIVFMPPKKFDADEAMRIIEAEKITVLTAVPTVMSRVLASPSLGSYDLTTLTTIVYGGAPTSQRLRRRLSEEFPWLGGGGPAQAYGMTESAGVISQNSGSDYERLPDSCGKPMPTIEVKIADPYGDEVPVGERGEVWARGPIISPGYWNRPEANARAFRDGWLLTGDIGRVDDDGFLFLLDRAKDMIIRGGENVYCVEVEDVLDGHPAVVEAAVIGVPDEDLGEEVKAIVVVDTDGGSAVDVETLATHARDHLADYKVPTVWEIRADPLPRNPAGKILKSVLRGRSSSFSPETESDSAL